MKTSTLRVALALSVLINFGVLGAIGYRAIESGALPGTASRESPGLARYLELDDAQQRHWHEAESAFLAQLEASAHEIHQRRDRLIGEIFADVPDANAIETERANIARLQIEQQRLVIGQLLREREVLEPRQRARLEQLLLSQPVGPSGFEQLHRE